MTTIQVQSGGVTSVANKIKAWLQEHTYEKMAHRFLDYLDKKAYYTAHAVFATILFEFIECLKYTGRFLLAYKPHFSFYGLNPKKLTKEQKEYDPVILLHGNYANQSTWLSLASKLAKNYKGPVFTINLDNGNYTQRDFDIIETTISNIKQLYNFDDPNQVITHIVGFSRGAGLARYMSYDKSQVSVKNGDIYRVEDEYMKYRPDVGRVIMIGSGSKPPFYDTNSEVADKFRYIHGTKDLLWTDKVQLKNEHRVDVESGHAGLVNHPDTHKAIFSWLNEPYNKNRFHAEELLETSSSSTYGG